MRGEMQHFEQHLQLEHREVPAQRQTTTAVNRVEGGQDESVEEAMTQFLHCIVGHLDGFVGI